MDACLEVEELYRRFCDGLAVQGKDVDMEEVLNIVLLTSKIATATATIALAAINTAAEKSGASAVGWGAGSDRTGATRTGWALDAAKHTSPDRGGEPEP